MSFKSFEDKIPFYMKTNRDLQKTNSPIEEITNALGEISANGDVSPTQKESKKRSFPSSFIKQLKSKSSEPEIKRAKLDTATEEKCQDEYAVGKQSFYPHDPMYHYEKPITRKHFSINHYSDLPSSRIPIGSNGSKSVEQQKRTSGLVLSPRKNPIISRVGKASASPTLSTIYECDETASSDSDSNTGPSDNGCESPISSSSEHDYVTYKIPTRQASVPQIGSSITSSSRSGARIPNDNNEQPSRVTQTSVPSVSAIPQIGPSVSNFSGSDSGARIPNGGDEESNSSVQAPTEAPAPVAPQIGPSVSNFSGSGARIPNDDNRQPNRTTHVSAPAVSTVPQIGPSITNFSDSDSGARIPRDRSPAPKVPSVRLSSLLFPNSGPITPESSTTPQSGSSDTDYLERLADIENYPNSPAIFMVIDEIENQLLGLQLYGQADAETISVDSNDSINRLSHSEYDDGYTSDCIY